MRVVVVAEPEPGACPHDWLAVVRYDHTLPSAAILASRIPTDSTVNVLASANESSVAHALCLTHYSNNSRIFSICISVDLHQVSMEIRGPFLAISLHLYGWRYMDFRGGSTTIHIISKTTDYGECTRWRPHTPSLPWQLVGSSSRALYDIRCCC